MRLLGFGESLAQTFDKLLLDHPIDDSFYLKWNIQSQSFDSSTYNQEKLKSSLTTEELNFILRDIKSSLIMKRFKNFDYNESKLKK